MCNLAPPARHPPVRTSLLTNRPVENHQKAADFMHLRYDDRYLSIQQQSWGVMSQDTTDSGAVEKCGATTASGTPCQNPADSCPHHDVDSSTQEESSTTIPDESAFTQLGGFIMDESDYKGKEDDSVATQAAKAWVNWQDGGTDLYRSVFGPCNEDDCSYGANGFDAEYCLNHQGDSDSEDEGDSDSTPSGVESKADFVKALMDDGLTAIEAAEKAEEVWS